MPTLYLTGASGALASAIRQCFLEQEGWSVAGFDRPGVEAVLNPSERLYSMDATDERSVEQAFESAAAELGPPDALIATVGGVRPWKRVSEMAFEDFQYLLDLNLTSAFLTARCAIAKMESAGAGGTIVTIGAEAALAPEARKAGYAAAKAGLVAFTQVLAEEGKEFGVTANCIVPTVIRTPANAEWGTPDDISKWTLPQHIAEMCWFLTTQAGRAVNGSVIRMPNRM